MRNFDLDKTTAIVRAAVPFLVVIGLSCLAQLPIPWQTHSRVNEAERLLHAERLLGGARFDTLANLTFPDNALEKFILSSVSKKLRSAKNWDKDAISDTIIREANAAELDPLFVLAVIEQESGFNVEARGKFGEIGLMQLRPGTARWISQKSGIEYRKKSDLLDPMTNIRLGVRYLAWLEKQFARPGHSIEAYNVGPGNLRKSVAAHHQPKSYCRGVMKRYMRLYARIQSRYTVVRNDSTGDNTSLN